jgi:hypothetical protein
MIGQPSTQRPSSKSFPHLQMVGNACASIDRASRNGRLASARGILGRVARTGLCGVYKSAPMN